MQKALFLCMTLGVWLVCNPVMAQDLSEIKTQLDNGNTKSSLKKLDKYIFQALSMKVEALTRLKRGSKALAAYEMLVGISKKENYTLLNKVSWSLVLGVLNSKSNKAHELAANYLGELGDKEAVSALIPLLRKSSMLVKIQAAEALGKLGDKKALPALKKLLKSRNPLVASSGAWAVAKIGDKAGHAYLNKCFKNTKRRFRAMRLRCAQFIARLGKRNTLRYLKKQMKTNSNRRARQGIAKALTSLGNKSWSRSMIRDLRSRNEATRMIAVQTLGEHKIRKGRRALQKLLKDKSRRVRIAAAHALNKLGSTKGISLLLSELSNSDALTRADAAAALIDAKRNSKVKAALLKALRDVHLLVRVHAGFALVKQGSQVGTGVIREGLARGNMPLKALAVRYALETARKDKPSSGNPLERKFGDLRVAKKTSAFSGGGGGEPDTDEPGDVEEPSPAAKKSAPGKPKKRKPKKRKPKKRTSSPDDVDDDW